MAFDPVLLGSDGTLVERLFGAALLIGVAGCVLNALGLRGQRRHIRALTHPALAWPLVTAGAAAPFVF